MSYGRAEQGARRKVIVIALASVLTLVGEFSIVAPAAAGPRPENWATPVVASPGLPNLHRVNSSLYRSAQPTNEGFVFLDTQASLANGDSPIKTVVSLRAFDDDVSLVPTASGLRLEQIRLTWRPEDEDVVDPRIQTTCNAASARALLARSPGQW